MNADHSTVTHGFSLSVHASCRRYVDRAWDSSVFHVEEIMNLPVKLAAVVTLLAPCGPCAWDSSVFHVEKSRIPVKLCGRGDSFGAMWTVRVGFVGFPR